jgi:hypothetical protein
MYYLLISPACTAGFNSLALRKKNTQTLETSQSQFWALLFAVGVYEGNPDAERPEMLEACDNLYDVLLDSPEYWQTSNIHVVTRNQGLLQNLIKELLWLRKNAKSEDYVLVYLTTHGYYLTRNGSPWDLPPKDEPDGKDEFLFMYNGYSKRYGIVWDDLLNFFLSLVVASVRRPIFHVGKHTLFRNWFSGRHVDANRTGNIKTVDLTRFSYYHNVVGNVLGNPDWPRTTTGRYEMTGQPGNTEQTVIYRLGYPNMGNNAFSLTNPPSNADDGGLDPKVKSTLMRWGNFDYQNNTTKWDASEIPPGVPVPTTQTLPASLYYSSKPSWWPSGGCLARDWA